MSRVPFRFHPAFRELPAQWLVLSYHKRSLLQDLWRLSADDCSGWIETARDPAQFLACSLDIRDRRDRQNAVRAIRELIAEGFIELDPPRARVRQTSIGRNTSCTPAEHQLSTSCTSDVAPDVTPADRQVPEKKRIEAPREKEEIRTEEREQTARPSEPDFRKPVGEPPPGHPAPAPPIAGWLDVQYRKRFQQRFKTEPGGAFRHKTWVGVGEWIAGNCEAYRLSKQDLGIRLLDGLFASERATQKRCPPSWVLTDPIEFCGLPPGVKPIVAEPKSTEPKNPTHQIWKAPDYEAEQRESEVAYRKRQEEWFREHPELRESAAEADDLIPKPRVVVSIVEAKPPKASRQMTPEELEERKRFLAEQVRALKAANAAQ